jgi:hypothetical protein
MTTTQLFRALCSYQREELDVLGEGLGWVEVGHFEIHCDANL